jgi:hypothetical protein
VIVECLAGCIGEPWKDSVYPSIKDIIELWEKSKIGRDFLSSINYTG